MNPFFLLQNESVLFNYHLSDNRKPLDLSVLCLPVERMKCLSLPGVRVFNREKSESGLDWNFRIVMVLMMKEC